MKTILLIEDDPFLIDIYTTKFKGAGFKVEVASDGAEGLRRMKEQSPDILLLDIVLPHVDGWEILKAMGQDEKLRTIKVVVLSNLGQKGDVEKGFGLGVARYLVKAHHNPSEVVEEIEDILKEKQKDKKD